MDIQQHTNRLSHEKSPYLLQHAHNPVDWFPWSDEAFSKAKNEDKPIFLSIGYSTCHWCHVMEKESFEDNEVTEVLNRNFISIKVDREERPDIDHIYMTVCQALTGHGGWPMTVFMTPDRKPFYAGTYFPKQDRMGQPGLISILNSVNKIWQKDKNSLMESSEKILEAISQPTETTAELDIDEVLQDAYSHYKYSFDSVFGGFGNAPKFPSPHQLYFLLRYWYIHKEDYALEMVEKTLDAMHKGGIYDHLGYGFSRYSTDRKWLVPHFEKMLYDNALLSIAYLETYQVTGKEEYAEIARQVFTYVLRDMTSKEGGFFSAEDADSEGVEGKFYVWTPEEVTQVLGERDGEWFCKYYDISAKGNFEGYSIPNLIRNTSETTVAGSESDFVEKCRTKLFDTREGRIHPYKDDKILTAWNGLMIAAMAMGGRILGEKKYTQAAEKAADFVLSKLVRSDGRLLARYRDGEASYPAYADDYAFMVWALIELYENTYNPFHLQKALQLNDALLQLFWDQENGGLFIYGSDSEQLITRLKEIYDGAMPSGNSVATMNFLRLARLTGRHDLEEKAQTQFKTFGSSLQQVPTGHSFMLTALLYASTATKEVVLVGKSTDKNAGDLLQLVREDFRPFTLSIYATEESTQLKEVVPFIENYKMIEGKTTAYVCENFSCNAPVTRIDEFKEQLN